MKAVYKATAIGNIYYYDPMRSRVRTYKIMDVDAEINRLTVAKATVKAQLNDICDKALNHVGDTGNAIIKVYTMMIDDVSYADDIKNIIRDEKINAEAALLRVSNELIQMFDGMSDKYMKDRQYDVRDITERMLDALNGKEKTLNIDEPVIIMAKELSLSNLLAIDRTKIKGLVVRYGSINSHLSIMARNMGIPTLIGVRVSEEYHGRQAVIDGPGCKLIIDPTDEECAYYNDVLKKEYNNKQLLYELKGITTKTHSGQAVSLYANVNGVGDIEGVLANGAEGIGLFRSEFLFMGRNDIPDEEEQFEVYKNVIESLKGKNVTIRTLDMGADKLPLNADFRIDNNPALGHRGIRVSLLNPELFKIQLRAIYRASVYGVVTVMFPIITSVSEIRRIKDIIDEVKRELRRENIPYKDIRIGAMIETPAAVMIADLLAKEVDFFSIGTNDLTQFALALDRMNEDLDMFYDEHHESIFRMIEMVVKAAHDAGIRVGICGELASDESLTNWFIEHGVDALSVAPAFVLPIRQKILFHE